MDYTKTLRGFLSVGLMAAMAVAFVGCAAGSAGEETSSAESTDGQPPNEPVGEAGEAISGCQGDTFYASSHKEYYTTQFTYARIGPGYGY